MKGLRVSC